MENRQKNMRRPMIVELAPLEPYAYFHNFLTVIGMIMNHKPSDRMSATEQKLLTYFLCLDYPKFKYQMFSTVARRKVRAMTREDGWPVTDVNMNTKISSLIDKGYLYRDEDGIVHLASKLMRAYEMVHDYHELNIMLHLPFKARGIDEG